MGLGLGFAVAPVDAATFVVNNVGDGADAVLDGVCATGGGVCTLRAAIQEANFVAGADNIHFNIPPAGAKTIVIGAALPVISSVVTIDGTTQPGFVALPPFVPIVEVSAAACGAFGALDLRFGAAGSTIRGSSSIVAPPPPSAFGQSNCVVAGNFLGTNLAGNAAGPGNLVGVYIGGSALAANNNRVGGVAAADRNVISGNTTDGVQINGKRRDREQRRREQLHRSGRGRHDPGAQHQPGRGGVRHRSQHQHRERDRLGRRPTPAT